MVVAAWTSSARRETIILAISGFITNSRCVIVRLSQRRAGRPPLDIPAAPRLGGALARGRLPGMAPSPTSLALTQDAIDEIRAWRTRDRRPEAVFRVDVRLGGCRGFKLFFDLEDAAQLDDVVVEEAGVQVVVQADGLPLVAGSVLDFEDSYRGRGFRLANPRARNGCGCGTSFMADYPGEEGADDGQPDVAADPAAMDSPLSVP